MLRILEVVGLTKRLGRRTALDAVSFTVAEGQILGLFGGAGAGKTTCLSCLAGFARPDSGRIIFDGHEITGQVPRRLARAGIAWTFQIAKPFRDLTAAESVMVALRRRDHWGLAALVGSFRRSTMRRRALELLERAGLGAAADRQVGLLPLAMLKRLELARALVLEPRLILVDEPLGGLSRDEMYPIVEIIAELRAQGLTLILAERPMRVARDLVDRAVVLEAGRVVREGPRVERPADPPTQSRPISGAGPAF